MSEPNAPTPPQPPDTTHRAPKRRRWPWVMAVIVSVVLAAGFTAWGIVASDDTAQPARPRQPDGELVTVTTTALFEAHDDCGQVGELGDEDLTLFLDMAGEDYGSGDLTVDDLACVLVALEAPDSVTHVMSQTRALDGRQSDAWDGFDATWSYHPDNGLDVIITEDAD